MYLKYAVPFAGDGETGELYAGISAKAVTAGFRIYSGSKYKAFGAGVVWLSAMRRRRELGREAEEAAWAKIRKLLVFGGEGRMERASRLADEDGRLEAAAGVDCAREDDSGVGDAR